MSGTPLLSVARYWLRVPASEWIEVKHGVKSEFRNTQTTISLSRVEKPTPVLTYTRTSNTHVNEFESRLMLLEESWREPLGAISAESLEREGFDTLHDFKVHWTSKRRRRFNPLMPVYVYRVRQLEGDWHREWADHFFNKLYPEDLRGL